MVHRFGAGLELDEALFELRREGVPVPLEPKVFDVLRALVSCRDQVLSKDELFQRVWPGEYVTESVLHRCIHLARKAIGDEEHKRALTTVRGRGYRFVAEVEARESAASPAPEPEAGRTRPADVFLGRDAVMHELRAAFSEAAEGAGRVALLVGEPGIGKTRVVEEGVRELREGGVPVVVGRCLEEQGSPPFWPWIQVLRDLGAEGSPAYELLERMEGAGVLAEADESALRQRFRLFDDFVRLLSESTRERPMVLVIDDLHWADAPSLLLFEHLAASCREQCLLLVGALRDERKERDHPFARTRGELARLGHCRRIELGGLDRDQVARFLEIALGRSVPDNLIDPVFERTEGNPLFLREVARWILSQPQLSWAEFVPEWDVVLPDGVRDVIERRIDALGPDAARVLEVAAMIGREFDADVLESLHAGQPEAVPSALAPALAARVIEEVSGRRGRYSFSHALVRETLLGALPHGVRVKLHAQIGETLEKRHASQPEAVLDELAHHFFEAFPLGGEERAIGYAERAAAAASRRLAHEEAAGHFERAVSMLDRCAVPQPERRLALQMALGDTWRAVGDVERLRRAFLGAADVAGRLGDDLAYAEAVLGAMGSPEWGPVERDSGLASLDRALDGLPEEPSALRARLLARRASHSWHWDEPEVGLRESEQALEMAVAIGDPASLAVALATRAMTLHAKIFAPGAIEELDATLDRVWELTAHHGPLVPELGDVRPSLIEWRAALAMLRGDGEAFRRGGEESLRLVAHSQHPLDRYVALRWRASLALLDGRPDQAELALHEGFRVGHRFHLPWAGPGFMGGALGLTRHRGQLAQLAASAKSFREGAPTALPVVRACEVSLLADGGRSAEARVDLEAWAAEGLDRMPPSNWLLVVLGELARAAFVVEAPEIAEQIEGLLAPHGALHRHIDGAKVYLGPVATSRAECARALGRRAAARAHYEDALEAARGLGAPPHEAWAQAGLAQVLAVGGSDAERRQAASLAATVQEDARRMGMAGLSTELIALERSLRG